jgi:hypothetical protein
MLQPDKRKQLDANIREVLANGGTPDDVEKMATDFTSKFSDEALKKKEELVPSIKLQPNLASNGLDTSLASTKPTKTGFPEIKPLPGIVPDFNALPPSKEKPKKEKEYRGQLSKKLADFALGSAQLGADIAAVPELLYDAFSVPQNAVADMFDIPSLRASSDKFQKTFNTKNHVKEFYQNEVQKNREYAQEVDKQYEQGIYDSFKNGDTSGGFDQLSSSFTQSLPATTSLMLGGAYAKAPQLLAASTMVFGAGKNEQLKKEQPKMNVNARTANAFGTGLAEGAFETLSSGSFSAAAKGLLEKEGAKKAVTILKDGIYDFVVNSAKKNPFLTEISTEGISEFATTVAQNSVDKTTGVKPEDYNVFTGAADAFLTGVAGGTAFGGIIHGIKEVGTHENKKAIKQNTQQVFKLQNELNNPTLPDDIKLQINDKVDNLIKANQKIIQNGKKNIEALHPTVRTKLIETIQNTENYKNEAKQIQLNPTISNDSKTILLGDLKTKYKQDIQTKEDILNGKYTPVDVLPIKQQDKIKKEALNQLTQELNPDGKKDITITNEMITKRANKLHEESAEKTEVKKTFDNLPLSQHNDFINQAHEELVNENIPVTERTYKKIKERAVEIYNKSLETPVPKTDESQNIPTPKSEGNLPLPTTQPQETGSESEGNLPLIQESAPIMPTVKEALAEPDKTYVYNGEKGTITTDGQQIVFETPNAIHELGNVEEISDATLDTLGIKKESISINKDNSIEIEGKIYTNPEIENRGKAIKTDKKGNPIVTLINSKNEKVTFRGPQAIELTDKIKNIKIEQPQDITSTETVPQPEIIQEEPFTDDTQTENVAPTDGNIQSGTKTMGKGTVVEQRTTPKKTVQSPADIRKSERNATQQKISNGKNKFIVYKQNGKYVVIQEKNNKPVNEATRKKILQQHHAENNIYAQGKKAFDGVQEDLTFSNPKQAEEFIAKNSENPAEIAEAIMRNQQNPLSQEESKDFSEQKIFDALKKNKLDESAFQFGDKNTFAPQKGFSYFAKENGRKADDLADEINVHPEEILDFIKKYPRLSDFKEKKIADNLHHDLEQKFEKLTEVKPTKTVLAQAIQQANQQSEIYTSLDAMSDEQLDNLYNEIQKAEEEKYGTNKKTKSKPTEQTNENSGNNQSGQERSDTPGENFKNEAGVKSISKRILEGQNSEDVTNAILATDINYEKDNQQETWNKVTDMFKEFTSFEIYQAIKDGTISNESAITAAYGQLLEQMPSDIDKEISKITNEQDRETVKQILWEEFGRIVDEFSARATSFGQANAMVNKVIQMAEKVRYNLKRQTDSYKAANNGVLDPETQRSFEETDRKLKELEDKTKALEQEKADQEAQQALENMQEETARGKKETPKQKAKQIANKIREIKIHKPNSFSAATPASLAWDLGVETVAQTIEAGGTITEAIQNGLEKIKNTKWFKSLSQEQQNNASKDFNSTFSQDKKGNIKAVTKNITTPNGVQFPANLFREYVEQGMNDIDQIAKQIKDDIADEYPDAEVRDIRDGLSGYGKTINPSKNEIAKEMSRLKSLGKLFSAKEDVIAGEMPKKSGFLKAKPNMEMRFLRKEIAAIMKEKGLDSQDLEKKWASALTKIKSSLKNQIEELDKQISTGEKRRVERTVTELDQEAKDLKAERDQKRALLDQIAGKPELTDEQKIKRAENALESSIRKLQEQIALEEFDAKKNNTSLDSPKLEELRKQKAELLKQKKQIQIESGAVEKARLEAAKKRVQNQMIELNRRIKEADYSKKENKPVRADEELRQLKEDKIRLFEVYDAAKYKAELKNRSNAQKAIDITMESVNLMRIASGLDLGLMFLQLGPLTVSRRITNPVLFAKDMVKMFRAMGSEKFSKKMNAELKARQYYPLAEECKLALTSVDYKLSINEDQFTGDMTNVIWNGPLAIASEQSKLANSLFKKERTVFGDFLLRKKEGDKLSIIQQWKNSNIYPAVERGLITYANILRMEEFEKGIEMLRIENKNQEDHLAEYKKVAAAVNTLTGRANLPKEAAGINKLLTTVFFSPRNAVAIINQVNPLWYASLQHDKDSGFKSPITIKKGKIENNLTVANKLAIHNMARYTAITTTFLLLVKAGFGDDAEEIEWDPRSYNAGKIIIKNKNGTKTTFDPWAGKYHQVSMFSKLFLEQSKDAYSGKMTSLQDADRGSKSRGEIFGEYFGNKLSPAGSFAWSYLTAKTEVINGQEVKVNKYTGEPIKGSFFPSLLPMYWAGFYELQQQDPSAFAELLGAVSVMGLQTNIIKKPKRKKKKSTAYKRETTSW